MFFALVFVGTLALLVAGYVVVASYVGANDRIARERLERETRRAHNGGGRYVGGADKPGVN